MTTFRRTTGAVVPILLLLFALVMPAPATAARRGAGGATDYTKVRGLSEPTFPKTARSEFMVDMADGNALYVEVTRPDPEAYGKRRWPVVMEASPYHGTIADREGTRIFPDPKDAEGNLLGLTGYFAPRGYAVAIVDLRGTGRSEGCLDHLGPNDASDLKEIVEWAASQPWSNGRVGMTGHSYVGSTPSIAAAQKPKGLVTIAPSAGLTSMYDHQFQYGVPYFLQWAGPIFAYEQLALQRDLPPPLGTGDNFGNNPTQTGCGLPNSAGTAGTGQATGQYENWHAERDHRAGATKAKIPVFMIHGANDNAARIPAAEWFFGRRFNRSSDKVWLGQWDHGSAGNTTCSAGHPNCRFEQWQYALHAWFDKHLQGRKVDTGPPVEVFLNDGRVWTAPRWKKPARFQSLFPEAADNTLRPGTESDGSVTFTSAPSGPTSSTGSVEFVSDPLRAPQLFVGLPKTRLNASLTGAQSLNLIVTVFREDATGGRHAMTYCAVQPLLRDGVDTVTPIVPAAEMELEPQCFTMAHIVAKGEKIVLRVSTSSPHHVSTHSTDARITVFTGPEKTELHLPLVVAPKLTKDVPQKQPS